MRDTAYPFKSDELHRVEVYWNLRKNCWSIRSTETGRLIPVRPHRQYVHMMFVKWVVQPGGRARVLRQSRKNVHAFARGYLVPERGEQARFMVDAEELLDADGLTYNPYKMATFQTLDTGKTVDKSEKAYLSTLAGRPRVSGVRCTPDPSPFAQHGATK